MRDHILENDAFGEHEGMRMQDDRAQQDVEDVVVASSRFLQDLPKHVYEFHWRATAAILACRSAGDKARRPGISSEGTNRAA